MLLLSVQRVSSSPPLTCCLQAFTKGCVLSCLVLSCSHPSLDLFSEFQPDLFKKFLTQTPHQLVKFKILKRSLQKNVTGTTDKRLIRVKNINAIPLGVWAAHVSNHPYFSSLIFFLIIVNAVIQGVQTGLDRTKDYRTFEVLDIFDDMTLILFVVEIILKWIDNFVEFWLSGWNVFDFIVTFIGAIPRAISLILLDSGSSHNSLLLFSLASSLLFFSLFLLLISSSLLSLSSARWRYTEDYLFTAPSLSNASYSQNDCSFVFPSPHHQHCH